MKKLFMCLFCLFLFISCGGNVEKLDKEIIDILLTETIPLNSVNIRKDLAVIVKDKELFVKDYNSDNGYTGEFWAYFEDIERLCFHGFAKNGIIEKNLVHYRRSYDWDKKEYEDKMHIVYVRQYKNGTFEKTFRLERDFSSVLERMELDKYDIERDVIVSYEQIDPKEENILNTKVFLINDNGRKIFEIKNDISEVLPEEIELKKFNEKGELFEKIILGDNNELIITKYKNGKEVKKEIKQQENI